MQEHIYIDKRRLDSYIEQVRSPLTTDKIPMWNVELSLTGPKVGGTQQRPVRPLTTHEKLTCLLDHLREKKWVGKGSPKSHEEITAYDSPTFRIDTLDATRLFLETLILWPAARFFPRPDESWAIDEAPR
jgi:hypothetical protein